MMKAHRDADTPEIADTDILDAMRKIPGYIDITPGDFKEIYKLAYHIAIDRLARSRRARDVMTRDVVSVMADTPLPETAALMARHNVSGMPVLNADRDVVGVVSKLFEERSINRVPVRDQNGQLIGIVSRADIIQTTSLV